MQNTTQQIKLFKEIATKKVGILPSTRYQGSKFKILNWIDYYTKDLNFNSVLDAFGGTGCVAYMYKKKGKQVFYNDSLKFNYYIGLAIIENPGITLDNKDVGFILEKQTKIKYPSFICYFSDVGNYNIKPFIFFIGKINIM